MVTPRRVLVVLVVLVAAAIAYTVWLLLQVRGDFADAERAADRLQASFHDQDLAKRDAAIKDFQQSVGDAADHTDGVWWSMLTYVPLVGDDAGGVRALSRSLDTVAQDGVEPMAQTVDLLDQLTGHDRIDLAVLRQLGPPVHDAHTAFEEAAADVSGVDTTGYSGAVRSRFDEYVDSVTEAERLLRSGEKATEVLPTMVGGDGPRDYLLLFQDNAEIRATGGVPWFWARIHSDNGRVTMEERGTSDSLRVRPRPFPLTPAEQAVYGLRFGTSFRAAGFTPDFPRAAQLMAEHWDEQEPGPPLDGVIALDPVAISYLIAGTGPLHAGDVVLRQNNVIRALLNLPYQDLDQDQQEELFRDAGRAIFEASVGELPDPVDFFRGMDRAASEERLLVAPFDEAEQARLVDTPARGALSGDDGRTPHVDIGLNDASGSKMSYYLRYSSEVRASGCDGGRQVIVGSMELSSKVSPQRATTLPVAVTGSGPLGTEVGRELVRVRLYGPYGGAVKDVRVNLQQEQVESVDLDGRPVVTVTVALDPQEQVDVSWTMSSGPGQTGDIDVGMTPSIVPGPSGYVVGTAC
jgi:hypothetical protein